MLGESGNNSCAVLTKTRFGGVPTRVPVPPILAEYAIPLNEDFTD